MIETREQAWAQLNAALDMRLRTPRIEWPEDLENLQHEAEQFLQDNPPAGSVEPVQIVLSPTSMGQIGEMIEGIVSPVQGALDKMSGAVDLLHRIADSQDLWLGILDFDTVLQKNGNAIELSKAERGYLRTILGDILTYAGRDDYLTEHLGPGPAIPPLPAPPTNRPPEGYALSEVTEGPVYHQAEPQVLAQQPPGVTIAVAPQQVAQMPVESMSPMAKARARRQELFAQMPEEQGVAPAQQLPPQPMGVEPWEGAPMHNCREWLDADDTCEQCGAVIQPIRPQVVDMPVG